MAEIRECEMKDSIPAGWEQRGKVYYCPFTDQEFESLDALLRYVSYAEVRQPELFDLWTSVLPPQKKRGRKRKEASTSTSRTDSKDATSGKPIIVYERRCKLAAKDRNRSRIGACNGNSRIHEESEKEAIPNAVFEMEAQKVGAKGRLICPKGLSTFS